MTACLLTNALSTGTETSNATRNSPGLLSPFPSLCACVWGEQLTPSIAYSWYSERIGCLMARVDAQNIQRQPLSVGHTTIQYTCNRHGIQLLKDHSSWRRFFEHVCLCRYGFFAMSLPCCLLAPTNSLWAIFFSAFLSFLQQKVPWRWRATAHYPRSDSSSWASKEKWTSQSLFPPQETTMRGVDRTMDSLFYFFGKKCK